MIPVHSEDAGFRVAIAELPRTARPVPGPAGSIVALGHDAPRHAARAAVEAGAVGLVVEPPRALDARALSEISDAAVAVPVIVLRRRLRGVAAPAEIVDPPAAVIVEGSIAAHDLHAALRDAIGLIRVLTGGEPATCAIGDAGSSLVAAIEARALRRAATACSLVMAPRAGSRTLLRATAIGPTRIEVSCDGEEAPPRVVLTGEDGARSLPTPWESPEREALRRAMRVLAEGARVADVAEWEADERVAEELARHL